MVILLTDGQSSDIKAPKDYAVIAELRAQKITVFTLAIALLALSVLTLFGLRFTPW